MTATTNMEYLRVVLTKIKKDKCGTQVAITHALRGENDKARRVYLRNLLTKRVQIALGKQQEIDSPFSVSAKIAKARCAVQYEQYMRDARAHELRNTLPDD